MKVDQNIKFTLKDKSKHGAKGEGRIVDVWNKTVLVELSKPCLQFDTGYRILVGFDEIDQQSN